MGGGIIQLLKSGVFFGWGYNIIIITISLLL